METKKSQVPDFSDSTTGNSNLKLPDTNSPFNNTQGSLPLLIPITYEPLQKPSSLIPITVQPLQKPSSVILPSVKINSPPKIKIPFYFEILEYILPKNLPNKSYLHKGTKIQILEQFYIFIIHAQKGENIAHLSKLQFGREGHVNFEAYDPSISRKQFEIILSKNSAKILCQCPPPKMPTSILITDEPFYLSKENIISFGKGGDFIFRVANINQNEIELQQITFAKAVQRFKHTFPITKINRGCVIGSFLPLNVPFIKDCKIKIEFDDDKAQWYITALDNLQNKEITFGSSYETYVWIFNHDQIPPLNDELPSKMESLPVDLSENMIINTGGCYLRVRSGQI